MYWHYTNGQNIDSIFQSRCLKPFSTCWSAEGPPAIWFSTNPNWEPTANRAIRRSVTCRRSLGTKEITDQICDGLFRISVRPTIPIVTWADFCEMASISPRYREACRRWAAIEGSHPSRWLAALSAIPMEDWTLIERWYGSFWGPIEGLEEILPTVNRGVNDAILQRAG